MIRRTLTLSVSADDLDKIDNENGKRRPFFPSIVQSYKTRVHESAHATELRTNISLTTYFKLRSLRSLKFEDAVRDIIISRKAYTPANWN